MAHIYLSGNDPYVKIGNFMADSIHGKKYLKYPKPYQKGILLHRAIDTFTDAHPTVRQSTKRLHPYYSHYSGVIVDIFYDHFLANNWQLYCKEPLESYTSAFYYLLKEHYEILPMNIKKMMPYMIADNWLLNYANFEGIGRVLSGMDRRTQNRSGMNAALIQLNEFYNEFKQEFTSFFEELKYYCQQKLTEL